jgi:very-short-patch-repair endonuclease
MRDDLDPLDLVRRSGGVVPRSQLVELGLRQAVDQAVAAGDLTLMGRKWVALPQARTDVNEARAANGVLAGTSAALHHGWAVAHPPQRPVVIVPRNRARRLRTGLDLRRRDLPPDAVRRWVLTPVATVIDCARTLEFGDALAVADSALRSGRVHRHELLEAASRQPSRLRVGVLRVIEHADGAAANPFESVARARAIEVGLDVVAQHWIDARRPDMTDVGRRIVVECDSYEWHAQPAQFRADVRRYTALAVAGWIVVRLVWEDVMSRPDEVRATLRAALVLAGTRDIA